MASRTFENLVIHQPRHAILLGKSPHHSVPAFAQPPRQIVGHTNVKRAIAPTGKHVDKVQSVLLRIAHYRQAEREQVAVLLLEGRALRRKSGSSSLTLLAGGDSVGAALLRQHRPYG